MVCVGKHLQTQKQFHICEVSSRVHSPYRNYDYLKVGLKDTILQFLSEKVLVSMMPFCHSMNQLSGSGVKLYVHLKMNSKKCE